MKKTKKAAKVIKAKTFNSGYFLMKWADESISVVFALDEVDLFWKLDREANPLSSLARIYVLPEFFHLRTIVNDKKQIKFSLGDHRFKRFRWSDNILEKAYDPRARA
jgi:hypothetical protein